MIYSFDVFDTVLMRMVLNPKDVFRFMQEGLSSGLWPLSKELKENFYHARIWAEFSANWNSGAEEVGIYDIYENMGKIFKLDKHQSVGLAEYEMQIESDLLVTVPGAATILEDARKVSGFVVFVSDMYLPSEFVRQILSREGLLWAADRLYLSNENGCSKRSGRLFQKVLEDLGIAANELCHSGDSMHSDVYMPSKLGVKTHRDKNKINPLEELLDVNKRKALYALDVFKALLVMRMMHV